MAGRQRGEPARALIIETRPQLAAPLNASIAAALVNPSIAAALLNPSIAVPPQSDVTPVVASAACVDCKAYGGFVAAVRSWYLVAGEFFILITNLLVI